MREIFPFPPRPATAAARYRCAALGATARPAPPHGAQGALAAISHHHAPMPPWCHPHPWRAGGSFRPVITSYVCSRAAEKARGGGKECQRKSAA